MNRPETPKAPAEPAVADSSTVHEVRNLLAIAIASVEGIIDGKFDPVPRMAPLLETLKKLSALIDGRRI
jgi:hypothetical protein